MRITCAGPHGQRSNQLLKAMNDKGGDDLRQDSVMQQVFDVANTLLHNNIETRRRALCVRTFKVIPMTPCVGLIEWCDNTTPIGLYLLGNEGAHRRYRPQDMKDSACREKMKVLQEGSSMSERACLKLYKEITTKFRPVFHHFFLERFPQPAQWFERRLAYTRSVAASSIVGYIVGLGDRHSHNILVDQATAAVIHIDLGVAFEQGKLLKTPETVPFRLTRDLVAGMGVTGCDGAFLRCAEETLGTLRDNKESLLTVLEVFFHDPLYKWAISPVKIAKLQHRATHDHGAEEKRGGGGGGVGGGRSGAHAERVLARLRQKLDGFESGHLLSAKGQVKVLVNGATDSSCLLLLLLRALA
jgi:ataxia telangiectasia mutated family protein